MSEKASNDLPRPSCDLQSLMGHIQYFVGRGFKRLRKKSDGDRSKWHRHSCLCGFCCTYVGRTAKTGGAT